MTDQSPEGDNLVVLGLFVGMIAFILCLVSIAMKRGSYPSNQIALMFGFTIACAFTVILCMVGTIIADEMHWRKYHRGK